MLRWIKMDDKLFIWFICCSSVWILIALFSNLNWVGLLILLVFIAIIEASGSLILKGNR